MKRSLQALRAAVVGAVLLVLVPAGVATAQYAASEENLRVFASDDGKNSFVQQFLFQGVNPNAPAALQGRTAVHNAAKGTLGKPAVRNLEALLQARGDPNARDHDGNTPLHLVSSGSDFFGDRVTPIRVLLRYNADPNRTNARGETSLHVAEDPAVVEALLAGGANPTIADGEGLTPLQRFLRQGASNGRIVTLLLEAGADPERTDSEGDAPLHTAVHKAPSSGKADNVAALLAGGADPCVRDARGYLPYHLAEEGGWVRHALSQAYGGELACDDSSEMAYEGENQNDDSSQMAYEEVAQLGGILLGSDGSDDSPEMGYERELRAWEEREEARRAEEARIAEEARKAKEARRAEEARSRQARRQQQNQVPDSRRSSNGAFRSSNCQDVTPTCRRVLATMEARMAPIKARLDAGGLSVSRSAELTAQMFKIFLDQAPICYATEIRPQCRAANQRDLEQARQSYESALETARQARGE